MDLFDFSKPLKKTIIKGSQTRGYVEPPTENIYDEELPTHRRKKGKDYVKDFLEKENARFADAEQPFDPQTGRYIPERSSFSQVDDVTSVSQETVANLSDFTQSREASTNVYHIYKFDQVPPENLSVTKHREKILDTIKNYRVTVIQGATGCGKTTQVPQFILNSYAQHQEYCNIVITQPRRIAALSVAHRVASERNCEVSTLVGYQVGQDKKSDNRGGDTRLLYCTTGVLLEKLIAAKHLDEFTHIVLDEVHERDQETDFLLVVLKKLMTRTPRTRIILMSATLEAQKLADYFPMSVYNHTERAPIIDVGEKLNFDVKIFYLDDLVGKLQFIKVDKNDFQFHKPRIQDNMVETAIYLLKNFDHIEKNDLKRGIINSRGYALVFLPGLIEIERMHEMITPEEKKELKWSVFVLHSSITIAEQETALRHSAPPGYRKIFLSTNIAESSLTLKDVKYVIDFCLTKQMRCDPGTSFTHLQLCWASHSNCIQRAGRVGRTDAGKVYRLVYKDFYEVDMPPRLEPEICVNPLDRVILRAKILDFGPPTAILAAALDPPDLSNIEMTVASLKQMGALKLHVNGEYEPDDGDITFAGKVMAALPLDPRLSRLILLGHIFCCADDSITLACALSNKSLFSTPFMKKFESFNAKLTWANASASDLIATLNAFNGWHHRVKNKLFMNTGMGTSEQAEKRWVQNFYLQVYPLRATFRLIEDVQKRLSNLNVKSLVNSKVDLHDCEKALLLKVAIAGAFYPQYFTRGSGNTVDEQEALKILNNYDPFSTVYLHGLPNDQPGRLYVKQIKELFEQCTKAHNMRVSFDGSSKVYVQFYDPFFHLKKRERPENPEPSEGTPSGTMLGIPKLPGKIHPAVYSALKLRQLRVPMKINCLAAEEAQAKAKELGLIDTVNECFGKSFVEKKERMESFIPSIDQRTIAISVTHVINPSHFYVIWDTDVCKSILSCISNTLNDPGNLVRPKDILLGDMYAVLFRESPETEAEYYRARILRDRILAKDGRASFEYKVLFIDFGNTQTVRASDIMAFGPKVQQCLNANGFQHWTIEGIPELAFQCSLAEIKPSQMKDSDGEWTPEAIENFMNMTVNNSFQADVFSVVYGVVSVILKLPESGETVNNILIESGLAEKCEESFLSLMDHFRRESAKNQPASFTIDEQQSAPYHKIWECSEDVDLNLREAKRRLKQVFLRGPTSPLEMRVHPVSRGSARITANIEWNSVNSVLLDTEPQNPNDRLLVASYVSTNEAQDILNLRDTTIMPNIRGMVGLMCLLFAPTAELRVNEQRTKITGALCGLGFDPDTNESYHPIDDVEISFDAEFSINDIETINSIRFWMNRCFCSDGGDDFPAALASQERVKNFLMKLLKRRRRYQSFECPVKQFKWNAVPKKYQIPVPNHDSENDVFKLIVGVGLEKEEPPEIKKEIRRNLVELYKIATCDIREYTDGICKLCNNVVLRNRIAIQIHMELPEHRNNEKRMFKDNVENFKEIVDIQPEPIRTKSRIETYGFPGDKTTASRGRGRGAKVVYQNGGFKGFRPSSSGYMSSSSYRND